MSYDPGQLRRLMRLELINLNPALATDSAVELLMLTAAAESQLGRWMWQHIPGYAGIPDNIALGLLQAEKLAYQEATQKILKYKPSFIVPPHDRLITDLKLSIWVGRCYYLRFIEPIPHHQDVHGLAKYWKRYWNKSAGKGTVPKAEDDYFTLAVEK